MWTSLQIGYNLRLLWLWLVLSWYALIACLKLRRGQGIPERQLKDSYLFTRPRGIMGPWRVLQMGLTVNYVENIKGLATEQYDALEHMLKRSLANDALIISQLEKIMTKQEQLAASMVEVDEATTVMAEAQTNIASSLTNISGDLDKLVAGGPDAITQESLDALGVKSKGLKSQAAALTQLAESAKTIANKVDDAVPVPPVVPPVIDPDTP